MSERICKQNANKFFWPELCGKNKPGWCLHHKDPCLRFIDPERYHQWNVEDLIPMTNLEHRRWHAEHSSYLNLDEIKFAKRNMEAAQERKRKEKRIEAIKKWREQKPNEFEKEPPKDESYSKNDYIRYLENNNKKLKFENNILRNKLKKLKNEFKENDNIEDVINEIFFIEDNVEDNVEDDIEDDIEDKKKTYFKKIKTDKSVILISN